MKNHKISGGNQMSLSKSRAARRLALFTGSSLGLAVFTCAVSMGAALTPGVASAQATCVLPATPVATGNGTNSVILPAGTYNPAISCAYVGSSAVVSTSGAITVSSTAPGGGIDLTAAGTSDIGWVSTAGTVTGSSQTNGAVIDARTAAGDISIDTAAVSGTAATVTYGIHAESTGGGDISITSASGQVTATNSTSGIAGVYAASNGGDVAVNQVSANGRLYGILASTTGTGNLTLSGIRSASSSSSGTAGIDASVQTGNLAIQVLGSVASTSTNGIGIRATTRGGDALIDVIQGSVAGGASGASPNAAAIETDMQGGLTTVNNLGSGRLGGANSSDRADPILRALGSGAILINNASEMYGSFQLSEFGGAFTLNNSAPVRGWGTRGQSLFSQGDDIINNLVGGVITIGAIPNGGTWVQNTSWGFGAGDDTINNAGMIVIGENHSTNTSSKAAETFTITGLETFNNTGLIVMGSYTPSLGGVLGAQTDLQFDDVLVMRDGHFNGEDGSRIWLDANFNRIGQTSCARNVEGLSEASALANPEDAWLRANDCLDFRGSAVSGRTGLIIADVISGDRGAYNPEGNVIVDVKGSDPADIDPDAFFIAPESVGYDPTAGGFVDKGLFAYTVGYDADAQAYKLYGVASPFSTQLPLLGQAANDLWRSATTPWLERRVNQRNDEEEGKLTPRFWMRGSLTAADRSVHDTVAAGQANLNYDTSYAQKDASLAIGMDLIRATAFGGDWLVGATAGYAQARLSFDASVNEATFEGGGVGLYSGFTAGPFYNDIVVNLTMSNLLIDVPSLQLTPAGTLLESDVHTLGAQMETGLRFAFGPVRVEPLAAVSWSQARFDAIDVPADDPLRFGATIQLDDARSTRAGLGLRLAMRDVAPDMFPIDMTLTGRSMRELDGESNVTIVNLGSDANLSKVFDGAYNELNLGVSVGKGSDHFGAFLNIGGVWGEDYESRTGSVGMRLRW